MMSLSSRLSTFIIAASLLAACNGVDPKEADLYQAKYKLYVDRDNAALLAKLTEMGFQGTLDEDSNKVTMEGVTTLAALQEVDEETTQNVEGTMFFPGDARMQFLIDEALREREIKREGGCTESFETTSENTTRINECPIELGK